MKTYDISHLKMTPEQKKDFLEGARKFAMIEHDPEDDEKAPRKVSSVPAVSPAGEKPDLQKWAMENTLTSGKEGWTQSGTSQKPITALIRHGTTALNGESGGKDRIRGHQDIPLNDQGREEAQEVADKLKDSGITVLISSDLSRAKETADIIADEIGAKVVTDPGFRPWKFGPTIEGKETAKVLPRIKELVDSPNERPEGGETFNEFVDRALEAFHNVQDEYPDQNVGIVTHFRNAKLLEAWRATGVDNDTIDEQLFAEQSKDKKPASFEVVDKQGNLLSS